jgi:hypothetical protein
LSGRWNIIHKTINHLTEKGLKMNNETSVESEKNLNGVIKFDAAQIHSHIDTVVRTSVVQNYADHHHPGHFL